MENTRKTGVLISVLGGFYYVESEDEIYECKARGVFRKKNNSPLVGDKVEFSLQKEGYCAIENILTRKNSLIRPPVANIDTLVIVSSAVDPKPNTFIIDKMTAAAVNKGIEPVVVITKTDLADCEEILNIYRSSGIKTIAFSKFEGDEKKEISNLFPGKIVAFTGNSGVGKSTLLNTIFPELGLETGDISKKLGRGRHTTRSSRLYKVNGGYAVDTPGFSTVDLERYEIIKKDELQYCFPEFREYLGSCKFVSCAHICEKGCSIIEAVNEGKIQKSRHDSYVAMYNEVKDIKEWERK